jgi:hypothetical protein
VFKKRLFGSRRLKGPKQLERGRKTQLEEACLKLFWNLCYKREVNREGLEDKLKYRQPKKTKIIHKAMQHNSNTHNTLSKHCQN